MATVQEAEVQFAQKLASNEKPVRSKAMKKLRKYINVRSQRDTGGFSGEELLKLWKGLFYCLWMQDKLLLQEELSNVISGLIHSFHNIDGQFLYMETFLQTVKREWTGIDRLRMDKFFQLVRFMFRQTFEMLKRKNWEESVVERFLDLLTAQVLQSSSEAPIGLQFHILDVYLTELAGLGSAELTADQNLKFLEPFCKTAAKTKDRTLFRAICSSIFSTIIDQAPYAIEDLMKELKAAEASDSGQASGDEEEEEEEEKRVKQKTISKPVGKKESGKQINGCKSHKNDDDDDDDEEEDDDDDLLHLDSDSDQPCDDDVGPVLQFDYSALADQLLTLSSRSNTPSYNRQRLYKIIKVLQDLSEGIFPQEEYPDEVSTDEDDEMFGSRKRMKRGGGHTKEEDEEGAPEAKKRKGKKKEMSSLEQSKNSEKSDGEVAGDKEKKRKKKKKKKKKKKAAAGQEQSAATETEAAGLEKEAHTPDSASSVTVTAAPETNSQSDAPLLPQVTKQPTVTVTEDQSEAQQETEAAAGTTQAETQNGVDAAASGKKKNNKKKKKEEEEEKKEEEELKVESSADLSADGTEAESQVKAKEEITPEAEAPPPAKRKNKKQLEDVTSAANEASGDLATEPLKKKTKKKKDAQEVKTDQEETVVMPEETTPEPAAAETPLKKKRKNHLNETSTAAPEEEKVETSQEAGDDEKLLLEITATTPAKKKKKKNQEPAAEVSGGVEEEPPAEEPEALSSGKSAKKKKKKIIPVTFEYEADEVEAATSANGFTEDATAEAEEASAALSSINTKKTKKKKKDSSSGSDFVSFQNKAAAPTPLFCRTKGRGGTVSPKIQTPKSESKKVTFGLKNNKTAEFKKTDRSLLLSPDGSSRVPFDPQQKPKFGVLKSPLTLRSSSAKKTPNRKKAVTPQRRRPAAADFF